MLKGEENELPGGGGRSLSLGSGPLAWTPNTATKLATLGRPYTLNLSMPICDAWIIRSCREELRRTCAEWQPWSPCVPGLSGGHGLLWWALQGRGRAWYLLLQGTQVTRPFCPAECFEFPFGGAWSPPSSPSGLRGTPSPAPARPPTSGLTFSDTLCPVGC